MSAREAVNCWIGMLAAALMALSAVAWTVDVAAGLQVAAMALAAADAQRQRGIGVKP